MQLDKKEDSSRVFHIDEGVFPFKANCPAREYYCEDYKDVAEMLEPIYGLSAIQHFVSLSVKVGNKTPRPISLESLANNPLVAHYLGLYSKANATYVKGYLFDGEFGDQPYILLGEGQAFDIIRNAISECEIDNYRVAKQQANKDGRH